MLPQMLKAFWISSTSNKKVFVGIIKETVDDMAFIRGIIEDGKMQPVIDRTYTLEQTGEAHSYVEQGHKKGNVAIELAN